MCVCVAGQFNIHFPFTSTPLTLDIAPGPRGRSRHRLRFQPTALQPTTSRETNSSRYPGLKLLGVSTNGGTPIAGWFIRENPMKIDSWMVIKKT